MVTTPLGHLGDQSQLLRVAMVQLHHLSHLIMSDRYIMTILFQSEKCNIGLQSFVIVFVCTTEPIVSILP